MNKQQDLVDTLTRFDRPMSENELMFLTYSYCRKRSPEPNKKYAHLLRRAIANGLIERVNARDVEYTKDPGARFAYRVPKAVKLEMLKQEEQHALVAIKAMQRSIMHSQAYVDRLRRQKKGLR